MPRAAGSARQARRAGGQRDFQPAGKTLPQEKRRGDGLPVYLRVSVYQGEKVLREQKAPLPEAAAARDGRKRSGES